MLFLQEALHDNLIKPKGDADVVNKLAEDMLPLSLKMKEINDAIRCLQDNTAEKDELQVGACILQQCVVIHGQVYKIATNSWQLHSGYWGRGDCDLMLWAEDESLLKAEAWPCRNCNA